MLLHTGATVPRRRGAAGREPIARAALDALAGHLCVLDGAGRIVTVNRAWREFAAANGVSPEAVSEDANYLAVCDAAAGAQPTAAAMAKGIRDVLAGTREEFSVQYECHCPEEQRWFIARVSRLAAAGPPGAVIAHENITQRVLAEIALRRSEERLQGILGSLDEVIWSWSGDTRHLLFLNPAVERLYGHPVEDFFADRDLWFKLIHPDDRARVMDHLPQLLGSGACECEYRIVRPDGGVRWVRDRGHVVRDAQGAALRLDGIVSDVTELRRTEDALRENTLRLQGLAAHLESVREEQSQRIAREVHDELGGTLTVLKLGLASVQGRLADAPRAVEQIESMLQLADSAIGTVKRISASLRPGMLDSLGLVATVRWLAGEFSRHSGIEVVLRLPRQLRLSRERSIAVYRIIQEALTNVARHARASCVTLRLRRLHGSVLVDIADNGIGITEAELGKTDAFGIVGMRERTQYLGGELVIRGVPGVGTTLSLRVAADGGRE